MGVKNRIKRLESRTKNDLPTIIIVAPDEKEEEAVQRYLKETGRLVAHRLIFIKVKSEVGS